jgi:tetratricopeptide (TPR) repeat protein
LYPAAPLFLVGQNFRALRMFKASAACFVLFAVISALFNVYYDDVLAAASGSVFFAVAMFYICNTVPALLLHSLFRMNPLRHALASPKNSSVVATALVATVLSFIFPFVLKAASHTYSVWLTRQGAAQAKAGCADKASESYARSAEVALLFRHYDLASAHYTGLGSRLLKSGDSDGALAALDTAEAYARKSRSAFCEKIALRGKSECFLAREDYASALAFTLASSQIDGGADFAADYAPEQVRIGALYLKTGNPAAAVGHLQRAQVRYRQTGNKQDLAVASAFLGSAYASMKQAEPAHAEFQNAVQLYEELGAQKVVSHLRRVMLGEQSLSFGVP